MFHQTINNDLKWCPEHVCQWNTFPTVIKINPKHIWIIIILLFSISGIVSLGLYLKQKNLNKTLIPELSKAKLSQIKTDRIELIQGRHSRIFRGRWNGNSVIVKYCCLENGFEMKKSSPEIAKNRTPDFQSFADFSQTSFQSSGYNIEIESERALISRSESEVCSPPGSSTDSDFQPDVRSQLTEIYKCHPITHIQTEKFKEQIHILQKLTSLNKPGIAKVLGYHCSQDGLVLITKKYFLLQDFQNANEHIKLQLTTKILQAFCTLSLMNSDFEYCVHNDAHIGNILVDFNDNGNNDVRDVVINDFERAEILNLKNQRNHNENNEKIIVELKNVARILMSVWNCVPECGLQLGENLKYNDAVSRLFEDFQKIDQDYPVVQKAIVEIFNEFKRRSNVSKILSS